MITFFLTQGKFELILNFCLKDNSKTINIHKFFDKEQNG